MRRADLLIGMGLLIFAAVYFQQSLEITRGFASDRLGPAFFPRLLAGVLAVLAITLVMRALSGRSDPVPPSAIRLGMFLGTLVLTVIYAAVMPRVGFVVATPFLIAAVIWLLGLRRWGTVATTALGVTVALYVVFGRMLNVLLP